MFLQKLLYLYLHLGINFPLIKRADLIKKLSALKLGQAQISMRPWERTILMTLYNIKNMLLNYSMMS